MVQECLAERCAGVSLLPRATRWRERRRNRCGEGEGKSWSEQVIFVGTER